MFSSKNTAVFELSQLRQSNFAFLCTQFLESIDSLKKLTLAVACLALLGANENLTLKSTQRVDSQLLVLQTIL